MWPQEVSWLPATTARRERGNLLTPSTSAWHRPAQKLCPQQHRAGITPNKRASHEPRPTSDEPEARGSAETPGAFERRRLRAASERALTRGPCLPGRRAAGRPWRPGGARARAPHRPRPPGRAARPAALRGEGAANYSRRDGPTPTQVREAMTRAAALLALLAGAARAAVETHEVHASGSFGCCAAST